MPSCLPFVAAAFSSSANLISENTCSAGCKLGVLCCPAVREHDLSSEVALRETLEGYWRGYMLFSGGVEQSQAGPVPTRGKTECGDKREREGAAGCPHRARLQAASGEVAAEASAHHPPCPDSSLQGGHEQDQLPNCLLGFTLCALLPEYADVCPWVSTFLQLSRRELVTLQSCHNINA